MESKRNPIIDFTRGTALLVILIDHVEIVTGHTILRRITLHHWGLSDALEAFVFISGYVFGLAYSRSLDKSPWTCQLKALRRCLQLVLANWLAFMAVLALAWGLGAPNHAVSIMRLEYGLADPLSATIDVALLRYQPFAFDILPLYIVILLAMPCLLWISRRAPLLAIWLSVTAYIVAQVWPNVNLWNSNGTTWMYHPLAWQFVFFIGMFSSTTGKRFLGKYLNARTAGISLTLFLLLTLAANSHWLDSFGYSSHWTVNRRTAGLLRLVHFLLLAIPTAWALNRFPALTNNRLAMVVASCGRHSLAIFIAGLILTYIAALVFLLDSQWWELLIFECICLWLTFQLARFLERRDLHLIRRSTQNT